MAFADKWRIVCAALVLAGATVSPAAAQGQALAPVAPKFAASVSYYVEFRVADIGPYGHSYIAFGRLGRKGQPATVQYADFHPEGGTLGLALGHVMPIAADMTPENDTLTLPVTSAFRRNLTAPEYGKVLETIEVARANNPVWNVLAYNCNSFVGEVAAAVGMKVPPNILFANVYIPAMLSLNEEDVTVVIGSQAVAPMSQPGAAPARRPKTPPTPRPIIREAGAPPSAR